MRELNDKKLLTQCRRIKEMMVRVAQDPAYQESHYAKYPWKCSPALPLEEIQRFEKEAGIELPIEYVYYLTQVGSCTRLSDFSTLEYDPEAIQQVSEQLAREMSTAEWEVLYGREGHMGRDEPGTLCLCGMDLTLEAYLIVNGPNRGRVVYLDWDGDCAPVWPKGSPDFLTWCEKFHSELLAGYNISSIWRFMWQEPGDEAALIRAYGTARDGEYPQEVLNSFYTFQKLSEETRLFLEDCPDCPGLAKEILAAFGR